LIDQDKTGHGLLTREIVININLRWTESNDITKVEHFVQTLIKRCHSVAKKMSLDHPFVFQDVFAGYSPENGKRLLKIQKEIDPNGVFQRLQPGYFKLSRSSINNVTSVHDEL
jgi:hypothetical protein